MHRTMTERVVLGLGPHRAEAPVQDPENASRPATGLPSLTAASRPSAGREAGRRQPA